MSNRVVYFNGRIIPESEARVSIFDSALQVGDMAYDVTRTIHHRPFRLREHLARLRRSMTALAIDPELTDDELEAITLDVLARNLPTEAADVDWNIVHDVSRGPAHAYLDFMPPDERRPTVIVACLPLDRKMAAMAAAYVGGVHLVIPVQRSIPGGLLETGIKCRSRVHYQLANLQADLKRRRSTAILLDPDGYLTEGTSGNVFFVRDGALFTPSTRNILPGVTRGIVLDLAGRMGIETHEADLTPAFASTAQEIFVTSTSIGIVPAASFECVVIPHEIPGPVTRRLQQALYGEVGLDFAAQAAAYAARNPS